MRRMDFLHINGEGDLVERPNGHLVDWFEYKLIADELAATQELHKGASDREFAALARNAQLRTALRRAQKEIWRQITADGDIRTGYVPGLYEEIDTLLATAETEAKP